MESREKFACGKAMQKGQNERPRAGALGRFRLYPMQTETSYPKANTDYTPSVMLLSIHTWWVHTHARAGR